MSPYKPGKSQSPHKNFACMAGSYFLGVFNDNFYKQAALILAVTAGREHLQGTATTLFSLPFILFSVYGGWLADRFAKRNVIIGAKGLELVAMLVGAWGMVTGSWACILAMVFLMGLQSALFGPALNGSVPELYPPEEVTRANAVLKLATTLAVLIGIAAAGVAIDLRGPDGAAGHFGRLAVAGIAITVALAGLGTAFGAIRRTAAAPNQPFPWQGPLQSAKDLAAIRSDSLLLAAIAGDAFFYFIASLTVLALNALGLTELGLTPTATSMLPVALMAGICVGAFVAAKITSISRWTHVPAPATLAMGLGLAAASGASMLAAPLRDWALAAALGFTGCAAGIFLIPIASFIQVRPEAHAKGRVIAASNFTSFVAIMFSGEIYAALAGHIAPSRLLLGLGGIAMIVFAAMMAIKLRGGHLFTDILAALLRAALSLRYRVTMKGAVAEGPGGDRSILFLANHPALVDPVILTSRLHPRFRVRPLADETQANRPVARRLTRAARAITIPDIVKQGRNAAAEVRNAMDRVVAALDAGDNVLLYPAGHLLRSPREDLGGNSAVEQILAARPGQRIVLVRTTGLWGSSLSWAAGSVPSPFKYMKKYLASLAANFIVFMPRRPVTVELVEPGDFPRNGDRLAINRHLEGYFNEIPQQRTAVPYFPLRGGKVQVLPEAREAGADRDLSRVPASIREQVTRKIESLTGASSMKPGDRLAGDLGLDSLNLVELATWLEQEFGTAQEDLSSLVTVADCILAAAGRSVENRRVETKPAPGSWFRIVHEERLAPAAGTTITEAFLAMAGKQPNTVIAADQMSGARTYRQMLTASLVLKPYLESIPGERLGIMLPASAGFATVYLAALFAGKTPVLMNWTVGAGNMEHCLGEAGVEMVVTAKALTERLKSQGLGLDGLPAGWLYLEDLREKIGGLAKLRAALAARLSWRSLGKVSVPETAAILFTSGSESKPKAVPLTHANLLANIRDFAQVMPLYGSDRLLGMLPPFHSLGLAGTVLLPLVTGLPTVYHPNPTEAKTLGRLIETYRATITIGTPTFLSGILQASEADQLASLRLAFTGAEKCPDYVYAAFRRECPAAVLSEGYGITECAPVVSVNSITDPRPGTIGRLLPSMEHRLVHPETGMPVAPGETGMLLLRGPNVFGGYLNGRGADAFEHRDGRRWYRTGDLVSEDAGGVLSFRGRLKRFIKLGGEMISLPAIESALAGSLNGTPAAEGPALAVEATASEEHPELVLFTTTGLTREDANRLIREAGLSALHNIRRLVQVDAIPVLGTGKTDYRQLKAMLPAN